MYHDGNTIAPMAEFAFRMRYDSDFTSIATLPLPNCAELGFNCTSQWPQNSIASTAAMPLMPIMQTG